MFILLTSERNQDGPRHHLKWLKEVMDKNLESKHTVMEASSGLAKSLVMLDRKILWQDNGIAYFPDKRHCERVVAPLNLQHAKTVVAPAVRERERAKTLMVRARENADGSRCGLLPTKVRRHRRMKHWTQTRRVCTEVQWPG